jgi:hypothetical protein
MSVARSFPVGSVRWAVAVLGDAWGLMSDPPLGDMVNPNSVFRAERHDHDVMRRCSISMDRGTSFDPRVWIGVPLTERSA